MKIDRGAVVGAAATAGNVLARRSSAPVVLYHSTYDELPASMRIGVHNVTPSQVVEQVEWLQRSYRFLGIDEWFAEGRPAGTAVVTFDDGYRCVMTDTMPLLIELGVPSTMFLNGATLRGETFWRDKVVFLMNHDLVEEFLGSERADRAGMAAIHPDRFYKDTKRKHHNSRVVDEALTGFLSDIGRDVEVSHETARDRDDLVHHPLVTYGNHSFRHYVPASLTRAEQFDELAANEQVLDELQVNRSRVYSIPFGGRNDVDEVSESVVAEFDFAGVVFSSNGVNFAEEHRWAGLPVGQRYMAEPAMGPFQKHHARLSWLPPEAPARRAARKAKSLLRRR